MSKTRNFRVVSGRIHFKCHGCQGKQMMTLPPDVRQRSIRCRKCGEVTRASFNRRVALREQQRGRVFVSTNRNSNLEVDLYDISLYGIGFDVAPRDIRKMAVGLEVHFRCTWNPRLFNQGNYIIRSIKGRRIGAQRR